MELTKNIESCLSILLLRLVYQVRCYGYQTNSVTNPDYEVGFLENPVGVEYDFSPQNINTPFTYQQYSEITTLRPPTNFLNLLRTSSNMPQFYKPNLKDAVKYLKKRPQLEPTSAYAHFTHLPEMLPTRDNPIFNPVPNISYSFGGDPFHTVHQNQPLKYHTNEHNWNYMYSPDTLVQMVHPNEPPTYMMTTTINETPSMMKGLKHAMFGMFWRIKSIWKSMLSFVTTRFQLNPLSIHRRSLDTTTTGVQDSPSTTDDKLLIKNQIAKHHHVKSRKKTHQTRKKKHSHTHKHKKKSNHSKRKNPVSTKKRIKNKLESKDSTQEESEDKSNQKHPTRHHVRQRPIRKRRPKIKKHRLRKLMMPLLIAYKLKFFTLIPIIIAGLVLLTGSTGMAGFFFALFAAVLSMNHKLISG